MSAARARAAMSPASALDHASTAATGETLSVDVISDIERAAVLLDPERVRLLQALADPDSASGLARRLGVPRQRLNYHLRALERAGYLELVEQRRKGNFLERVVRATARSFLISPDVLGSLGADPAVVRDRFSASYLIALAARTIREVATLRTRASAGRKRLATLSLDTEIAFASAQDRTAFAEELANELARLAAKYHLPDAAGARTFRVTVGAHPRITSQEFHDADPHRTAP